MAEADLAFWVNELTERPPALDLPSDRARPSVRSASYRDHTVQIPSTVTAKLGRVAAAAAVPPSTIALAAYALFLGKAGSAKELVVGYGAARLPLVVRMQPDESFVALARRLAAQIADAEAHAPAPLDELVRALDASPDPARHPLFDVGFGDAAPAGDLHARVDLGGAAAFTFSYDANLFSPPTIERLARAFLQVLGTVGEGHIQVGRVALVDDDEAAELLEAYSMPAFNWPRHFLLHELFEARVDQAPDAIALTAGAARVTYAELDARANEVAHVLAERGVGPDVIVALVFDRSIEMIVALVAVLKAGGAYLPIEADTPAERLRYLVEDSGAALILTTTALAARAPAEHALVCIDEVAPAPGAMRLLRRCQPHHLAYVIYTSGSTGQPKGVLIEHKSVVHLVLAEKEDLGVRKSDAFILLSSYTFDASVAQIWFALASGCKLTLVDKETILAPHALTRVIADEGTTHLDAVPGLLASLSPAEVPTVNRVVVGGETCPVALARVWSEQARFFNEYGPTETTVTSLRYLVAPNVALGARVPVGRPIGMTRAYVLDWGGCPVPLGVRGELHLGGAGVARGYLGRPELTRERFVPDPFVAETARMYRTGDLCAFGPTGELEFFGRVDSQVKLRGFRIELGEIEAAMLTHPDVSGAAASVYGESDDAKRLCCHFVAVRPIAGDELRAFLGRTLPGYMIPDAFVALAAFPTTVSGKIDRKRLPAPSLETGPIELPVHQIETEVRAIWAELLRLPAEKISVTRSFFELGGHSLLVMQLVSRLQRALGVSLRASAIIAAPTIRAIAAEAAAAAPEHRLEVPRADARLALPATSVQRRMYVIQQGNPRSTSYNLPLLYEIDGELAEDAIAAACAKLVERHESLRTALFFQEGRILQKIAERPRFALERYDLAAGLGAASAAFVRPFVLENPPLFRAAVFVDGERPRYLALDLHHIIADGMSIDTLMEDLTLLLEGREPEAATLRYVDYAAFIESDAGKERRLEARAHWANLLHDELPVLDLPYDFRRPLSRQQASGDVTLELDRALVDAIAARCQLEEATPFAFFTALYSVFLSCLTGSADVVFGYPTAGRPHPDLARVIGMFVNTLVFRGRVDGQQRFGDFLRAAMTQIRDSLRNDEYPFEDLVEDLRLQPAPGRNPIFDTMLSFEGVTPSEYRAGAATLRERRLTQRVARMDLVLVIRETDAGYALRFEYSADLFKRATVERFARELRDLVRQVLDDKEVRLGALHTLGASERQRLVVDFNATDHALPPVKAVHELFERHAAARPDAPAVVMGERALSYAELDARANALAHRLKAAGVGRDVIVGILLDPCPEMLLSVLAVGKAGGAFMPIDPDYPLARKQYMLADSGAAILLTRGALAEDLRDVPSLSLVDLESPDLYQDNRHVSPGGAERSDVAYVIYTSGSTGKPKGVLVEHRNLLNFAAWYADYFAITPDDGVSKYAGFGFDASIAEVFPAAIAGARLVVIPAELRLSIEALDDYFAATGVTVAFLPTQFGEQFLRHAKKHALGAAFLGGEKLRARPTERCLIVNGYGPTECTVAATAFRVDKGYDNIPIGKPIWNTQIAVLDRLGRIAPVGVPGELCIAGTGVARGYLNQPVLTAEKFVEHPLLPGRRVYRTGDLARWLDDGNLEFLGRIDTQVKVRGFRIELGEIEQALMALPGVDEAVVVARESPALAGDLSLVGFVTGAPPSEEDAKAALQGTLPGYMVPSRIVALDEIPLTANGKVDKRRLPAVELDTGALVAPRSDGERELRRIYAEVLGMPENAISVDASFLDLGGHSLKAAVLLSAIYQQKGAQLPLADFLAASSVAEVARVLDGAPRQEATAWETAPPGPLPLTSSQQRIFAVHQLATWSTAYNVPFAWELDAGVDLDRLERALKALCARHHALRTSFVLVDGIAEQRFADAVELTVERLHVDDANLRVTLDHLVQPFDLGTAPLLRAAFVVTESKRVLALDVHHIVADGLSVRLLLEDLEALYLGRALPAPSPTFADYVHWERGAGGRQKHDEEKSWWLDRFSDRPDPIELPYDFDRPPRLSFEGDLVSFELPAETSAPLLEMSKARGITPLGTFFAAWAVVLSRLGNNPDVVIGVPAAGRHLRGTENLVGMFVNTVPIRLVLDAEEPFADLCVRASREAHAAFERQSYQLNDLVADLQMVRDPSRNPLFDVLFAWEEEELATVEGSTLGLHEIAPPPSSCKFDLELTVQNTRRGQTLSLGFRTKLFQRATAEKFLGHVRRLLEQVAKSPELRIRELRMLQPWEREMLLEDFNRTDVAVPAGVTLVDLFSAEAAQRPDAIAVEDEDGGFSFAELEARSGALAARLAAAGVGVDDVVALSMHRTRHLYVGILGILKAGAGYLPIEPDAPAERVALMVEDSGAKLLVSDDASFGLPPEKVLAWHTLAWRDGADFVSRATPSATAYVIYTSGSTGKPKGVVIEHRNVVNFIASSRDVLAVGADDRILLFSSFTFDASVAQIGLAMVAGARLVIPSKETLLDHEAFERFVTEKGVTHLDSVPLFLSGLQPRQPLRLARIVVGGDICPIPVAARWAPAQPFYNEYGPTETTITALRHKVRPDDFGLARLPIGRPVANTRIYILDWTRNLAPLGVPGEMYIGGAGVARGYLNNEKLTQERFVQNPYVQGDRLYKTGDIARWTRDGAIDFLGRADNQIKIRGFRVELGEIEAALLRHDAVAEAAVVVMPRHSAAAGDDKRLVGYVVLRRPVPVSELRSALLRGLPNYMVPEAIVELDALPVTTSGKIDRKRLPEPVLEPSAVDDAPASEAEARLLDIWADVLKLPAGTVPLDKSFFELGGHSLLIMLYITRVQQAFGVRLQPGDIFDQPTIRGQATLVAGRERQAIVPIPRVGEREHYPLSSVQRRLYAMHQANPESVSYNMPSVFSVDGRLMRERLEEVVRALFSRHASFRTSFALVDGEPVARVHASVPFSLEILESDEPIDDLMAKLMQPFDLAEAPLARVWLVRRPATPSGTPGEELLVVDMHHIIVDGYSTGILWRELSDLVLGKSLTPLSIQYSDFAAWQQSPEHKQTLDEQKKFWLAEFATLPPPLSLPFDFRRPAVRNHAGDLVVTRLSKAELDALTRLSQSRDSTLFATLLSCYFAFLARIGGSDDLCVGVPASGRVHPDIQDLVGMFVNTVPWRARVPERGSFLDFLAATKQMSIDLLSREEYQLEDLLRDLGAKSSLFDVMFVFQAREPDVIDCGRVKLHARDFSHRTAKMDLVLIATESGDGLELAFEYPTELFARATVERLARHFVTLVRGVLADPEVALADLPLLGDDERKQLLVDFNATYHELPAVDGAHQLFERWVEQAPATPAVIFGADKRSYREVNERANQIAAWLLEHGVGKNDFVGVLLDPCAELLAAILGVLKAGAAFLPVDPEYPVGRKSHMLADSGARALLTRADLVGELEFAGARLDVTTLPPPDECPNPDVAVAPEDAAYVIYTSGSTGKPKGVVIEHKSLVNFALWYADFYKIAPKDGVSKYAGFSFDASICEIFPACISGATLVVVPAELRLQPKELSAYFEDTSTRVAFLPTQFGEQFMRLTDNHTLRMVTLAGEKLRTYRATPWQIINGYGPTEYTVCTSAFVVDGPYENIPIGKPVWNTQVLILDKRDRLCPIGIAGELCISGKGLARGYLNRPELTAEKFTANPFVAAEKMYRTGDLARWLPDGNLEFLGRIDTQVKVRGFRVELGEIEQALLDLPGVKDATVVDARDEDGGVYLAAYVVGEVAVEPPAMRAALGRQLPEYMIPAHFCRLEALPLTPNGKVDRKRLPAVERPAAAVEPPANQIEERLLPIWAEVLHLAPERLSVTASFVDLGGHSLKAIALATEVYRAFAVELRVSDVFRHPTIRAMGERLTRGEAAPDALQPIARQPPAESYPVSSVQRRMFLLQQMGPSSVAYNIASLFQVAPSLDKDAVVRALGAVVERHDAFRCFFTLAGTEPRLCRADAARLPIAEVATTEAERDAAVAGLVAPFALTEAPLARAAWVTTEAGQYLFFDMHHIVADGASIGLLVDELRRALAGEALPPPPLGLVDCAAYESSDKAAALLGTQREYWQRVFVDGVPVLGLFTDRPRPAVADEAGATLSVPVADATLAALRDLARRRGLSLYSVMLAAFNVFLARLTRQDEIVVGTPVHGRWHPDMQNVFGMFVNTLVLLNRPVAKTPFVDFAEEVGRRTLESLDHQAFPFAELVELVGEGRPPGHSPLFDVMFVMQSADDKLEGAEALLSLCPVANHTAKFDLTLLVEETSARMSLAFEFRTSLFRAATIERYLRSFARLLDDVVARPEAALGSLSILTDEDRALVADKFNRTAVDYPEETGAHKMFETVATLYSDKRALVAGERAFSYAEVEARANRLAHRLIALGAGRDGIVALLSPPSCELFIAELAVLKAGAAFLPLDHRYPRDRIEYTLRDSAARILLSAPGLDADLEWLGTRLTLDEALFADGPATPPAIESRASDLAYVIYTSGSTGRPKGVSVEHRSLVHLIHRTIDFYRLDESDRLSKYLGVGFDASIIETFPALCSGAELHLVPEEIRLSPDDIEAWMRRVGITWTCLPTQFGEEFFSRPRDTKLRWLVMGGDRLRRFAKTPFAIVNEYGPTEFTVCATAFVVDGPYENIPIGKPNPNSKAFILDAGGALCPPGVPGELCLAGKGVARGYLGNPELTAKKFVAHPLAGGERMYHTGDMARWLDDGNIEFLGRIDSQVKIRGFRIELGEIEQAMLEIDGVTGCTVIDRVDGAGDKMLCGYYVAGEGVRDEVVRASLAQRLPEYMVPATLTRIDEIPFNTSGKVDRRRLPEPVLHASARVITAPTSVAETLVLAAFARALGRNDLGIDDDFFALGGNSLKAVAVVAALASDFRINANDLFRLRTARAVAREIPMQRGDLQGRLTSLAQSIRESSTLAEPTAPLELLVDLHSYHQRCRVYDAVNLSHADSYRNILLTGATGFLGCYLLRDLLARTDAKLHVAVRARSRQEAWERLVAKAAYYFGPGTLEAYRRRVILVLSDLAAPQLGLDGGTFDALGRTIDCVIHSAALTKHYGDYSSFVAANVDATHNLIALTRAAAADFNMVSTISVGLGDIAGRRRALFTEFDCNIGQVAGNHYVRTKLLAEEAAIALRQQGRRANIFRVGFLTGDSTTLRFQENADDSGFVQKLKSFAALGSIPVGALRHSFCPVNEVSDAIVRLFALRSLSNETHHIDRHLKASDAERICRANHRCRTLEDAAFYEWLCAHLEEPGIGAAATAVLLHEGLLDEEVTTDVMTMREKTERILRRIGFSWSDVSPAQVWSLAGVTLEESPAPPPLATRAGERGQASL